MVLSTGSGCRTASKGNDRNTPCDTEAHGVQMCASTQTSRFVCTASEHGGLSLPFADLSTLVRGDEIHEKAKQPACSFTNASCCSPLICMCSHCWHPLLQPHQQLMLPKGRQPTPIWRSMCTQHHRCCPSDGLWGRQQAHSHPSQLISPTLLSKASLQQQQQATLRPRSHLERH